MGARNLLREDDLAATAEGFRLAAIGQMPWESAMGNLASTLGSRTGQLIAIGRDSLVPLNIMTGMPPEAAAEFQAFDGGSPLVNSRVRAGLSSPEMVFLDEQDFDRTGDIAKTPEFGAWMERYRIGYTAITTLVRDPDSLVGLALFRDSAQDAMDGDEKRAFMTLAASLRAAVVLSQAVETRTVPILAAGFESLALAAMVCDLRGKVGMATSGAQRIIADGLFARLSDGKFIPHRTEDRRRFEAAMAQVLATRVNAAIAPPAPIVLWASDGSRLVVEIVPLSRDAGFTFAAAAVIILRSPTKSIERLAEISREMYGLTRSETAIVALMLRGLSPGDIAPLRQSSIGTVRNHVHHILMKAGCSSQMEFVAAVNSFG